MSGLTKRKQGLISHRKIRLLIYDFSESLEFILLPLPLPWPGPTWAFILFIATGKLYISSGCLKTQRTAYHSPLSSGIASGSTYQHKLFPQHSRLLQSNPTLPLDPRHYLILCCSHTRLLCPMCPHLPYESPLSPLSVARGPTGIVSKVVQMAAPQWGCLPRVHRSRPILAS